MPMYNAGDGGPIVSSTERCTHVVADRTDEKHAQEAQRDGKMVVTLLWLFESIESGVLQPLDAEPVMFQQSDPSQGMSWMSKG